MGNDERVQFRLPAHYGQALKDRALPMKLSGNQLARCAVVMFLENTELLNLLDELRRLGGVVGALDHDVGTLVQMSRMSAA